MKKSTARQRAISTSRLAEIIKLCKKEGVQRIKINGNDVELELFPFAVSLASIPQSEAYSNDKGDRNDNLGHNDDKTDLDLLLHSAT